MGSSLLFILNLLLLCFYCFGKSFYILHSFEFYQLLNFPYLFFFFFFATPKVFFVSCPLLPLGFVFIVVVFSRRESVWNAISGFSYLFFNISYSFFTIASPVIFGSQNFVRSLAVPSGEAYYNNIFKCCPIKIYLSVTFVLKGWQGFEILNLYFFSLEDKVDFALISLYRVYHYRDVFLRLLLCSIQDHIF